MTIEELKLNKGSIELLAYLLKQEFCTAQVTIQHGQLVMAKQIEKVVQAKDFLKEGNER